MAKSRLAWVCLAITAGAAALAVAVLVLSRRAATIAEQVQEVASLQAQNREQASVK